MMQWHDLLGAVLIDFFDRSPFIVETEVDLSQKKQLLDIVVIRKKEGEFRRPLPDGFGPLATHNLISFKSHQDTFDWWTIMELMGHYVNYRKQFSPKEQLLAESEFRLMGISARFPEKLAKEANAMLQLFSLVPEQIRYACQNYQLNSAQTSGIVENLLRKYQKEDVKMPTTIQEIYQKIIREVSVEDRLEGLTPDQLLKRLTVDDRLKNLPPEERLKGLTAEEIELYLRKMKEEKAEEN